ncbi:hypothetical protein DY000_02004470 [Brassica cretica]|uniref:Uncharacterized protein n=1 Tax=Brassica cretica TaxID=69181 RepID=A0ABQ7CFJ0_BRACR|nr:hypothetical protein DY000_02004470 [Brassica cretica]
MNNRKRLSNYITSQILQHKLFHKEQQFHEVSKPLELLKNLVMLLEIEKEVAMEENSNLGYKVTSLLEENRELATEALLMNNEEGSCWAC